MPCQPYKDALLESVASGATLPAALTAHLAVCTSCREAFVEEQSLFAAIDAGLEATANAEVPPTLLPRVRARLEELSVGKSGWNPAWFLLAGGAVVAAAWLLAVTLRQDQPRTAPLDSVLNRPAVPEVSPHKRARWPSEGLEKAGSLPWPSRDVSRNLAPPKKPADDRAVPETLVSQEQEALLARYAQQWSSRRRAPLLAEDSDHTVVALLDISPIQIAELDVKPLAEGKSP